MRFGNINIVYSAGRDISVCCHTGCMFVYALLIITLLSYTGFRAEAASDTSRLLQFNIENGFPSNNVYSVIRDRNGYLWFATNNGVVKYNGYKTRIFTTNDGLPSNDIWQLQEDSYGRVWLLSHSYQFGYIKDDQFRALNYKTADRVIKPEYLIQIGDKVYYIFFKGGHNRSLVMADANGHVTIVDSVIGSYTTLISRDSIYYVIQSDGSVTSYNLDGSNKRFRSRHKLKSLALRGGTSHHVLNNNLYVFSFKDKKILSVNIVKESFSYKYLVEFGAGADERIYTFYIESGELYLVSNKCIYILNPDLTLKQKIGIPGIIAQRTEVSYFFKPPKSEVEWYSTNSDGAWLGFGERGLFQSALFYKQLDGARYIKNAIGNESYWLAKDKRKLLALNAQGQLRLVNVFDDELRAISKMGDSLLLAFANGLYKADNNFARQQKITGDSHKIVVRYTSNTTLQGKDSANGNLNNLATIHEYAPGKLFAASGIFVSSLRVSGNSIFHKFLIDDRINSLFFDSALNRYIFYNKTNISILDPETEQSVRINADQLASLGIVDISSLQKDHQGTYFIHAGDKLYSYNYKHAKLTTRATPVNLSKARIAIHNNTLCIAGNFGFAYANIFKSDNVGMFKIYPNPRKTFYNNIIDFSVDNGLVQISTDKGFYCFRLDQLKESEITKSINEYEYISCVVKKPVSAKLHQGDTLFIDQQYGKIDFDVLNYYGVGDIQYQYKIPQRSPDWNNSTSGEVVLNDLQPGVYYEMRLTARDDAWKSRTYLAYIYIIPHWYQTSAWKNTFWIVGIILGISLIAFVVLLTRYIVARSTEKKQSLVDMELRALYSQINPHFIFNTLSTALFFISKKRYDEAYNHVSRFSKLLRTYLTSSRKRYIILADEIEMLRNYIELQQIRFEEKFDYSIEVDNKVPAESMQIPTLLLQPLVENAINHGLFHRAIGGLLSIEFIQGKDNNELICVIEDNGVGRQRAKEIKKESVLQYESYGTQLTKELIEIFKKYEDMNIYLEYTDKPEPETGTIVKLTIRNLKYVA